MNIVLVRQGTKFAPAYVEMFRALDPLTLTDQSDTPGRTRALIYPWQGWWAKMELFSPENKDMRPCLFFDLDTYILSGIDDMLAPFEGLGMLRDFYRPSHPASGILFVPEDTTRIWDEWIARPQHWMDTNRYGGDQAFLAPFCDWFIQDRFAGIHSYKVAAKHEPCGRIVCFHGRPKPHEVESGWAKDRWTTCSGSPS